jgi:hypothetical protein
MVRSSAICPSGEPALGFQ